MEQEDLIESIENPANNQQDNNSYTAPSKQYSVNPLPEDLGVAKKKMSFFEIINLVSYATLGFAALFMLILYIIGFMK